MNKVYKGYELIKEIAEGNIAYNQKFDVLNKDGCLWIKNATINDIQLLDLLKFNFELIEDQTIDIDSIEELKENYSIDENRVRTNELIQAVKHLNKEIQSIKK